MIRHPKIWNLIGTSMPRTRWVPLDEIYLLVERNGHLDDEDLQPQSPRSDIPKWKRNTRNVLQYRRSTNEILWDGNARYMLP